MHCWHVAFIDHSLKCLRSVCYHCSSLLLTKAETDACAQDNAHGKLRFVAVYNAARQRRRCAQCGAPQPLYSRVPGGGIKTEWPTDAVEAFENDDEAREVTERVFSAVEAYSILKHISDEDVLRMGLNPKLSHPKWTVSDVLLVPPPVSRPAIMQSTGSRCVRCPVPFFPHRSCAFAIDVTPPFPPVLPVPPLPPPSPV